MICCRKIQKDAGMGMTYLKVRLITNTYINKTLVVVAPLNALISD